jgi:hypothetical protein
MIGNGETTMKTTDYAREAGISRSSLNAIRAEVAELRAQNTELDFDTGVCLRAVERILRVNAEMVAELESN